MAGSEDEGDAVVEFPRKPEDRLRLALRRLDEALDQQRVAVAELRGSMAGLKGAVGSLGAGLLAYQGALDGAAAEVAKAHGAALELGRTAEALEAAAR